MVFSYFWWTADEHFAPKIILLPGTLYSSAHFNHRTTLELEYFALWNSLLPGTLYFLEQFAFSVPGSKGCWEGHLQISKVFQEVKCNKKQKKKNSVLESKMCWGVKCAGSKVSPRSKVFKRVKCSSASTQWILWWSWIQIIQPSTYYY